MLREQEAASQVCAPLPLEVQGPGTEVEVIVGVDGVEEGVSQVVAPLPEEVQLLAGAGVLPPPPFPPKTELPFLWPPPLL